MDLWISTSEYNIRQILFKIFTNLFIIKKIKQNVWNSRINTTATFVKAITKAENKPNVFVSISGVSLYRPSDSKIYTEDDKGEDFDYMSNLCLHWEKAAELPPTEPTRLVSISLEKLSNSFYLLVFI